MDKLEEWELPHLFENIKYSYKNELENTRLLMYIIAQVNSKKQLKISDIMKFSWDDEFKEKPEQASEEKIKSLFDRAKQFENTLNKK